MPSRLIHVRNSYRNTLCLEDTKGTQLVSYAALSYCWGDAGLNKFKTEKETLALRKQGFDLIQLPKTLQDAVKVTRTLGLDYLWVDALCIIQDCEADKNKEISKMWQIYHNATIVISAAKSSHADQGFLHERNLGSYYLSTWAIPWYEVDNEGNRFEDIAFCAEGEIRRVRLEPIDLRAWTLQEHKLANRVLRFGSSQMVWRCAHCYKVDGGSNEEEDPDEFSNIDEVEAFYEWKNIVKEFTTRSITKAADRLPAFAAVAADYAERHNIRSDQYMAGLWTPWLAMGLLWYIKDVYDQATYPDALAVEDRSPTWSWHLARSGISWHESIPYQGKSDLFKLVIKSWQVELADDKVEYGRVERGSLEVFGALLKICLRGTQPVYAELNGSVVSAPIQIRWDSQDIPCEEEFYCLEVRRINEFIPEGIVLKQNNGAFYRVGYFEPDAAQRHVVPRSTLVDRLNGRRAVNEQIHPRRRLSKSQEDRLAFWILRQESLGYAPSHSQIRACVMGLLLNIGGRQGEQPDLGRKWVTKFINRRADLKTKIGRRQEAKRFDSFTPKAVHWYFDIRDGQYGWIKLENTVNVDEGGLDSLVVRSADPRRKAFLKGPQTRNWTSFIEAITADGRVLVTGIIFKGKELQKQWFLDEFKQIADWYYITSPNGWTDDHIGIEWLERVYLPQTTPADESDARLIILDGQGSHAIKFAWLTDSAPMDKVNFIRAYAKARRVGMTEKNILSGLGVTGNWPISRAKALRHPEIQEDRPNGSPTATPEPRPYFDSDDTPQTSRQICDLGLNKTPKTRRRYSVIAKSFGAQQQTVAAHTARIASLDEKLARLKRGKKRKAVPNPNKRYMTLGETLAGRESILEGATQNMPVVVESVCSSEQESEPEAGSVIEVREEATPHQPPRRSRRMVKKTRVQ
ncbi:transposase [Fusarium oxysporum f. sp. phaseoli]